MIKKFVFSLLLLGLVLAIGGQTIESKIQQDGVVQKFSKSTAELPHNK